MLSIFLTAASLLTPDLANATTRRACEKSITGEVETIIDRTNLGTFAIKYSGLNSLEEGTTFANIQVLSAYVEEVKRLNGGIAVFFESASDVLTDLTNIGRNFPLTHSSSLFRTKNRTQLVERSWDSVVLSGEDFLMFGAFVSRSVFAEYMMSGSTFPDRETLEHKVLSLDPALIWNDDGTISFYRKQRRQKMIERLENRLNGNKLTVHRGQPFANSLLVEFLKNLDTAQAPDLRNRIIDEFRISYDSTPAYMSHTKPGIRAKIDKLLASKSDRDFAATMLSFNDSPYFFTSTETSQLTDHFVGSRCALYTYELDLSLLPASYKNRIYMAPDGKEKPFYPEVDLPWGNLEDAIKMARALKLVDLNDHAH
ncbi:MAG: hypothetical protein V4692_13775 [Bdellovibrionota bacterium]